METSEQDRIFSPRAWYDAFRACSPATRLIPVPRQVAEYFVADGLFSSRQAHEAESERCTRAREKDLEYDSSGDEDGFDNDAETLARPTFPEFEKLVDEAIEELGGRVSPKVSFRCPEDAAWISFNRSTMCASAEEVMQLVKGSDRVAETLSQLLENSDANTTVTWLSLRQWVQFDQGMEFRCFTKPSKLLAFCQRHTDQHFDYLEQAAEAINSALSAFCSEKLPLMANAAFGDGQELVLDVYLDRRHRVWVVDIAPMSHPTDPLLIEWHELSGSEEPFFRLVDEKNALRPAKAMYDGLPFDLRGASGMQAVAEAAQKLAERDGSV